MLSRQGGLYATCAYSTEERGIELWNPNGGDTTGSNFCREERDIERPDIVARAEQILEEMRSSRTGQPTTPAPDTLSAPNPASSVQQAEEERQQLIEDRFDNYLTYIWANSAAYLEGACAAGGLYGRTRKADPGQGAEKKPQAQLMNDYHHDETFYKGMALVVST